MVTLWEYKYFKFSDKKLIDSLISLTLCLTNYLGRNPLVKFFRLDRLDKIY